MMEAMLVVHPLYSQVCHNLWYNTDDGTLFIYSTDEGDLCISLPIDIVLVSREDNSNTYAYNPLTRTVGYNILNDPNLFKVEFSTLELPEIPPIGPDTLKEIFRSGILTGKLS